jgi:hypothetical protein
VQDEHGGRDQPDRPSDENQEQAARCSRPILQLMSVGGSEVGDVVMRRAMRALKRHRRRIFRKHELRAAPLANILGHELLVLGAPLVGNRGAGATESEVPLAGIE